MARTDAIVLGAGIVGTSIALQLAKRGLSVALIDRAGVGEQTSYGNSGVIEGSTILPPAFPSSFAALLRVAFKRASDANYHLTFLPKVAPWLLAFRAASRPERIVETARLNRPLFARSLAEHETLMAEAGATRFLRKTGWLKLYRDQRVFAALTREFDLAREFGLPLEVLDADGAQALEPSLNAVFSNAVLLAEGGEPERSAGGDARLCRALSRARRGHVDRRRPLIASRGQSLAGGNQRRRASMRPKSWSRSGPGRPICSNRSASSCRWR